MPDESVSTAAITTPHPNGHFYSPVVDPAELELKIGAIWPEGLPECVGVDFNDSSHLTVLEDYFKRYIQDYDYPEHQQSETGFFTQNPQFSWLDSRALFVLLRTLKPNNVIEVGSGFSSLLMADVNHRFLNNAMNIVCIEPYPRDFLNDSLSGLNKVMVKPVQDVPLEVFQTLESGDLLFIDSSHVSKTGSDLNYLMFEVIRRG